MVEEHFPPQVEDHRHNSEEIEDQIINEYRIRGQQAQAPFQQEIKDDSYSRPQQQ